MLLGAVKKAAQYGDIFPTKHARQRMAERNASAEDVKRAILTATRATYQPSKKTTIVEGGIDWDDEPLTVSVAEHPRGLCLVSVMGERMPRPKPLRGKEGT